MRRMTTMLGAGVLFASLAAAACGGNSGEPSGNEGATGGLEIAFTTEPDPAVTGQNTFRATVMHEGQPVTDATVSTEFFMAAMPSMNMPEMRTTTAMTHEGNGLYRGTGQVMMAGRWDVTVTVTRDGEEIGRRTLGLTAK